MCVLGGFFSFKRFTWERKVSVVCDQRDATLKGREGGTGCRHGGFSFLFFPVV